MCGICGIFDLNGEPIDPAVLSRMNRAIRHRGPDGEGTLIDREVALGHRRLSIIDLEGGAQPLGNEDGSIQVVFNGEIYNFIELRSQLESAGHAFHTRSDTEVIVHAYEQWGTAAVEKFNGMFAFALWDSRQRQLLLARDHLGVKPLYYVQIGNRIAFASEIKALLEVPGCPREVDLEALSQLFTFRYVPSPRTLFKGILKLPPAHWLKARKGGYSSERFWSSIPRFLPHRSEVQALEEYQALLEDAVRLQLRSDVPLGLFLSSGIDSGVLLALMRQHHSGAIRTFTIGFEGGEATNEVADAAAMARQFDADHKFEIIGPADYVQYYERYMRDIEEPLGNETAAAFYFVSRITSKEVKVALTGQGADEPWAGYDRYKGIKLSGLYSRLPGLLTNGIMPIAARLPGRMERLRRGVDSLAEPDILKRFAKVYSFFSEDMKRQLYRGELLTRFETDAYGARHALARLQADVRHLDPLTQMLYIDTRANLPDDLLMVSDKTSMACSLEARVPFLDVRLIEFVESLPTHLRLRGLQGKYLHKKACLKWLPRKVVYRKKKGFDNPIATWMRTRMRPYLEDLLLSPDSAAATYFDQDSIRQLLAADREGRQQLRRHVYLLLSFELWHRSFLRLTN